MKTGSLSLALLLLAGVATSAPAQERELGGRGAFLQRRAPQAVQAPTARPAPEPRPAAEARSPRQWPLREGARAAQPRPRELPSAEGARRDWSRGAGERRDWSRDRGGHPDVVRPDSGAGQRNWRDSPYWRPGVEGRDHGDRDGVDRNRVDRDRLDRNRPGGDLRDHNWDRNRDWHGGRSWDHDRHVRPDRPPVWQRGRYPPTYNAPKRYRGHVWRSPPGYYVRSWRIGEYLPFGWYEPSYQLLDWWLYDLPEPPYGYEWVRVGADAVLVDTYSGHIVQVVRSLFW